MKISILVEGKTEMGFKRCLLAFLATRLAGNMPKLDFVPYDGRIPKGAKLRRVVENLLGSRQKPSDAVIALTDVYTGTNDFKTASDAKQQMQSWAVEQNRFPLWRRTFGLAVSRTNHHGA